MQEAAGISRRQNALSHAWRQQRKQIYGGQLTLSDPSHRKELAVWEDTLRRLTTLFLGHEDLDVETVMEDLC